MIKNDFYDRVYSLLMKVPLGKVTTYKELANALNSKAYRHIGRIMKNNNNSPVVPCHRVIRSNGEIGGFAFGVENKKKLLISEGVEIVNGKIDLGRFGYR